MRHVELFPPFPTSLRTTTEASRRLPVTPHTPRRLLLFHLLSDGRIKGIDAHGGFDLLQDPQSPKPRQRRAEGGVALVVSRWCCDARLCHRVVSSVLRGP